MHEKINTRKRDMFSIGRDDFKLILIGLSLSCVLMDLVFYPVFHMAFQKAIDTLDFMPILLTIWTRSSIFISGLYVGLTHNRKKFLITVLIALLYMPASALLEALIIPGRQIDINLLNYAHGSLKNVIAAFIGMQIAICIKRFQAYSWI